MSERIEVDGTPWLVLFTIILMVLKLTGVANITWLWVFSPLWLPFAFVLGAMALVLCVVLIVFIIAGIAMLIDSLRS
jgi:hypothetical protein